MKKRSLLLVPVVLVCLFFVLGVVSTTAKYASTFDVGNFHLSISSGVVIPEPTYILIYHTFDADGNDAVLSSENFYADQEVTIRGVPGSAEDDAYNHSDLTDSFLGWSPQGVYFENDTLLYEAGNSYMLSELVFSTYSSTEIHLYDLYSNITLTFDDTGSSEGKVGSFANSTTDYNLAGFSMSVKDPDDTTALFTRTYSLKSEATYCLNEQKISFPIHPGIGMKFDRTPSYSDYVSSGGYYTYKYNIHLHYVSASDPTTSYQVGNSLYTPSEVNFLFWFSETRAYTDEYNDNQCFTAGTLITLADGSQKPIESITAEDMLLVFNPITNEYESQKLWFMIHDDLPKQEHQILNLQFENGELLRIVHEHGVFDKTLGKYVYLSVENAQDFVGHEFLSVVYENGKYVNRPVKLIDAYVTVEAVTVYTPISEVHLNCVASSMLTVSTSLFNMNEVVNMFAFNDDGSYNLEAMEQDILLYGIFEYEELADRISIETYDSSPVKYFKVAIEKGLISTESLNELIAYLKENHKIT